MIDSDELGKTNERLIWISNELARLNESVGVLVRAVGWCAIWLFVIAASSCYSAG